MKAVREERGRLLSPRHHLVVICGFCVLLLVALFAFVATELARDRERTLARVAASNANLARAFEKVVVLILRDADSRLLAIKRGMESGDEPWRATPPDLVIADRTGSVLGPGGRAAPASLADREFFQFHAAKDPGQLHISQPVDGVDPGHWSVFLSRRINLDDGSFGGVVALALDAGDFVSLYAHMDIGPQGVAALVGRDGAVRARHSAQGLTAGQRVGNANLFTGLLPSSDSGSYVDQSRIDGVRRIFTYKALEDYPLVVLLGTSKDNALQAYSERRDSYLYGALGASLLILVFGAVLVVQLRRQASGAQELGRARQELAFAEALTREDLERRVARRTAELAEANRRLEAFSYSVSHDLRTPLRAISGFAQILARRHRESLNHEGRYLMDRIVRASAQMGRLIEDLLAYSKLGRKSIHLEAVNLNQVIVEVAEHFQGRMAQLGARLEVAPGLPLVDGDRTLIVQILTNLFDNALTYCRTGAAPVIEVTCRNCGEDAVLGIADNGIGIAPEHFGTIFGVFQRLHSEEKYPGTGIGLATVKQAVEMLGGKVWLDSRPGEGTVFFVRLRAAQVRTSDTTPMSGCGNIAAGSALPRT